MMKRYLRKLPTYAVLAIAMGMAVGCASTKELQDVRALAEAAKQTATDAMTSAEQANTKADRALSVAGEANIRTTETDDRIDQMFKKAMQK